jgi:endonuclease/exonuclease/phosphatase family metal-dependent hydrolase
VSSKKLQNSLLVLAAGLAVAVVAAVWQRPQPADVAGADGEYLLCFWNVENLFDDHLDPARPRDDREFDTWFAENPQVLDLKLKKLSEALVKLNGGKGPDILAVAEVESIRAAALLQKALNDRLDPSLHYQHVLMKEVSVGRHIAPAIITRLAVVGDRTRLLDKHLRILEGHLKARGQDLVVIASHWTSRLRGGGAGRDKYASRIYGQYKAMSTTNPAVDLLVCGDFNDNPTDPSVVKNLHAVADVRSLTTPDGNPRLLNLFAARDPNQFGTHYDRGKWSIFDQILISPGLLDQKGWSCDPASAQVVNTLYHPRDRLHRPWRFGSPQSQGERGYSDHFPVTVKLKVHAPG